MEYNRTLIFRRYVAVPPGFIRILHHHRLPASWRMMAKREQPTIFRRITSPLILSGYYIKLSAALQVVIQGTNENRIGK